MHWTEAVIYIFCIMRILLNLQFEPLNIFFIIVYAVFLALFYYKLPFFKIAFILWLAIDSMIGTYLATIHGFTLIYWGTMAVNLGMMVIAEAAQDK